MGNPYEAAFAAWHDKADCDAFKALQIINQLKAAYFAGVKIGKDMAEAELMKELSND